MKRLVVSVEAFHIERGFISGKHCPLALALKSQGVLDACVGSRVLAANRVWELSKPAKKFVDDFDDGKSVEPATFHLKHSYTVEGCE